MTTSTRKNFGGVDALRFVAAMLVMFFHFNLWNWAFPLGLGGRTAGPLPEQENLRGLFVFGWIGVQIFFVISGFVISFSAEQSSARAFFISRSRRLIPAVIICAPITALVLFLWKVESLEATSIML